MSNDEDELKMLKVYHSVSFGLFISETPHWKSASALLRLDVLTELRSAIEARYKETEKEIYGEE